MQKDKLSTKQAIELIQANYIESCIKHYQNERRALDNYYDGRKNAFRTCLYFLGYTHEELDHIEKEAVEQYKATPEEAQSIAGEV